MIGFTQLPGNINSYIQRIADKVKTALSQGKPVDFYVRADRNGSAVLSSVPIRIKALGDTVTIPGANERNTNEERQRQAHNALMGAYQHEDEQIDRIRAKEERVRQTKEIRFEELLRASKNKTSDLTHFNAVYNMLAKYYPAGKPVSVSRSIRPIAAAYRTVPPAAVNLQASATLCIRGVVYPSMEMAFSPISRATM